AARAGVPLALAPMALPRACGGGRSGLPGGKDLGRRGWHGTRRGGSPENRPGDRGFRGLGSLPEGGEGSSPRLAKICHRVPPVGGREESGGLRALAGGVPGPGGGEPLEGLGRV